MKKPEKIEYFVAGGGEDCESSLDWEVGDVEFWMGYEEGGGEPLNTGGSAKPVTFREIMEAIKMGREALELNPLLTLTMRFATRDGRIISVRLIGSSLDDPVLCRLHVFSTGGDRK